jgi:hypothetical protein
MSDADIGTGRAMAQGATQALGQVVTMASNATGGLCAFRDTVRRMPVAMSLVLLGFGYLIGRVAGATTTRHAVRLE